jgi:hypothetical protein
MNEKSIFFRNPAFCQSVSERSSRPWSFHAGGYITKENQVGKD